jgi:hypothetical protein
MAEQPHLTPAFSSQKNHRYPTSLEPFPNIDEIIADFRQDDFLNLTLRKRFKRINQMLYQLIKDSPPESYLLSSVLDFMKRINEENILQDPLDFATFEFWLNNFSELSEQENYAIRTKIIGKYLPREDYQVFFPIGMGKTYAGTHFVTAHLSPDVDTMVASFWGWMDAFGARVGTGLHVWSLPGGPPDSPVSSLMSELFGDTLFTHLARTSPSLTLSAMDLVTQKQLTKELGHVVASSISHGLNENAIILVNENGHYLGDWRSADVELVRQIVILFKSCLHWFENNLHSNLISLFAKEDLSILDLATFNKSIFDVRIIDCEPAQDFNEKQNLDLNDFFIKILGVEKGLTDTFRDLNAALDKFSLPGMLLFQKEVEALPTSDIFDSEGRLRESRPKIFNYLKELIRHLDDAIFIVRNYVERLDIVLDIKYKVLGLPKIYITLRSDVDEMRKKIQTCDFLTVVIYEQDGSLFPVGIVREKDLLESGLGTVTLRDFCNREEVHMAPYLEIISVIDHHKSSLKTISVPTALIGDAQSCNVLIAEQTFIINDKYSLGGLTSENIDQQIQETFKNLKTPSDIRIFRRLLKRRIASKRNDPFFIHPDREIREYISFLHAIIDDTDLLTRTSRRDLECVGELLNRVKSLMTGKEVEIIHFDDIPVDSEFIKKAAQRILQQEDMYALYKKTYSVREEEVEANLSLCAQGKESNIFLDTKVQNGCARIGQTKLFTSNFPLFLQHLQKIRQTWLDQSSDVNEESPEIDLHLHMICTIPSADEVFKGKIGPYSHQDQLWIWTPETSSGYHHLNSFLAGFVSNIQHLTEGIQLDFLDSPPQEFVNILSHHFYATPKQTLAMGLTMPMAVLQFKAGTLNSRKSMISPYLPRLI